MTAVVLPLGAIVTGFVLVALPTVLLMAVWTVVTVLRILFPERPLPFDAAARRQRARIRGESVPVRLRDILEDQARQPVPAPPADGDLPDRHPLADDLWLRRN
ncbi:hypothetical protein RQM47_04655 [Rubrivirga sp. S365]|uniref:Uncharacterized protein n=1 Tax=Rubrivirga litoralis TaxID=3075598 RepID=A0ABU3BPX1_9BACT|nr:MULTISPECIES: hypothetical protein [unclassified Rubrivirga]MDT0631332.1 hypothetical protein [Rubrivirga sp. F394]MDT7855923.1 hypothetical protein [Rubrivirga sp. S365]